MKNRELLQFATKTKENEDIQVLETPTTTYSLIIFNDDYNTFEHVIKCLIEICEHETVQAEQCTHLIHYKGKCCVKIGELEKLQKMNNQLLSRGLSSEIVEK